MKKSALLLSFVFAAGVAMAQEPKAAEAPKAPEKATAAASKPAEKAAVAEKAAAKTHDVDAEYISSDATKKTITLKTADGEKTVPVEGKALASLKTLKANEKVTVTCRDNEKGEHQAVTAIKPAAAAPAPAKK